MQKNNKKKEKIPQKDKLTPRQERFCQEYIIDLNAAGAARRAGYKNTESIYPIATTLLRNVKIQKKISELRKDEAGRLNLQKESIMQLLSDIASAKIEDITDPETGAILSPEQWPEHMKRAVNGLEADEFYGGPEGAKFPIGMKRKVKLADRLKAIELLNRMLGFNMPDKVAATTPEGEAAAPVINVYTVQPKKEE